MEDVKLQSSKSVVATLVMVPPVARPTATQFRDPAQETAERDNREGDSVCVRVDQLEPPFCVPMISA
jgi:hypothetical protein